MNLNQLIIKATSLKVIVERVLIFCLLFQGVSAQGQTKNEKNITIEFTQTQLKHVFSRLEGCRNTTLCIQTRLKTILPNTHSNLPIKQ